MLRAPVPNYNDRIEFSPAGDPILDSDRVTDPPINFADIQYAHNESLLSIFGFPKQYAGSNISCEIGTKIGKFRSVPAHILHVNDVSIHASVCILYILKIQAFEYCLIFYLHVVYFNLTFYLISSGTSRHYFFKRSR